MFRDVLIDRQNRDGGWPYIGGSSRTEPTVYAILALLTLDEIAASERGLAWLREHQLRDGGWGPEAGFDEGVWVTSLVALLPPEKLGESVHQGAIRWLLGSEGKETTRSNRLREWLLGNPASPEQEFPGWPWIPETAAWVGPTSLAILALAREQRRHPAARIAARIESGRNFLLRRMCASGGWNHGSVRALGYESQPYPETTGMALAALHGSKNAQVTQSVELARRFLVECRSADAHNWLRLGLMAHGALPETGPPSDFTYRTITEQAMDVVVSAAQKGYRLF